MYDSGNCDSEIIAENIKELSKVVVFRQRRQMLRMAAGSQLSGTGLFGCQPGGGFF